MVVPWAYLGRQWTFEVIKGQRSGCEAEKDTAVAWNGGIEPGKLLGTGKTSLFLPRVSTVGFVL